MIRSMMSGVSGLRAHTTRMDVIANDIANVNTVGYKQSDVTFKETFVSTLRAPATGTPAMQVGLGSDVGEITKNWTDGVLVQTGQSANMAIAGNGFFVVNSNPPAAEYSYSRAGDFLLDSNGTNTYLINATGQRLYGWVGAAAPGTDPVELDLQAYHPTPGSSQVESFSIAADGAVSITYVDGTTVDDACYVALASFANNYGLEAIGSNLFKATTASGDADFVQANEPGTGTLYQGYLENSNVDLAAEFTDMILTQRGFQANSRSITTADEMLMELLQLKR